MRVCAAGFLGAILMAAPATVADASPEAADPSHFVGPHPLPEDAPGRFCYIGVLHLHDYVQPEDSEFVTFEGHLLFTGDPSEHGYEGPLIAYRGQHPTRAGSSCSVRGDHFHLDPPAAGTDFVQRDGAFVHRSSERRAAERARSARRVAEQASRAQRSEPRRVEPPPRPVAAVEIPVALPEPAPEPEAEADATASTGRNAAFKSWMQRRRGR